MNRNTRVNRQGVRILRKAVVMTLLLPIVWIVLPFATGMAASLLEFGPLLGRPTASSVTLNIVAGEQPVACSATYWEAGKNEKETALKSEEVKMNAETTAEIILTSLKADTRYHYRIDARRFDSRESTVVAADSFKTQKLQPGSFSFALLSDAHLAPSHPERLEILAKTSSTILSRRPEFLLMLGDNIQTFTSHGGPMTDIRYGPYLYRLLRQGLGSLPGSIPVFKLNGNWEGENGWHPLKERGWAKAARKAYFPNPGADTYPQGGSPDEDYYGFIWGDVLFLALNVTGYTPTNHAINSTAGQKDDWTLGEKQKAWLHAQLAGSKVRWKLLFIHHTVAGHAGDEVNSRYGRGGGRAAKTGEQALIHGWMRQYGVQALFYGHDHVFTDIVADGIHYVCVGSAGAPWKFGTEETGYEKFWTPSGFTWVNVSPESLNVSFIGTSGAAAEGRLLHTFVITR
ncbi:MAG: metallophosphoesterase [Deltaproteobacteria bacterium]|nr:metallophosphoesterase [Deltaproteobacteria bacterium]